MNVRVEVDPFIKLWESNYSQNFIQKNFARANTKPFSFLTNTKPYQNLPVVMVAAGPSLDKNIQELKDNQDRCIILCADIVYFRLAECDIIPDFVVNIDPHETFHRFWTGHDTTKPILVCPTTTHPKTVESWKGRILFFNQSDFPNTEKGIALDKLTKPTAGWGFLPNRYFVGATMMQVAQKLNPKVMLLMGYDFGFTDNKPFCDGVIDRKVINTGDPEGTPEWEAGIKYLKEQALSLEGQKEKEIEIDGEKIWTTNLLVFYKDVLLKMLYDAKIRVINTTEGGIFKEIDRYPFKQMVEMFCTTTVEKKDIFILPKRKRKKR